MAEVDQRKTALASSAEALEHHKQIVAAAKEKLKQHQDVLAQKKKEQDVLVKNSDEVCVYFKFSSMVKLLSSKISDFLILRLNMKSDRWLRRLPKSASSS